MCTPVSVETPTHQSRPKPSGKPSKPSTALGASPLYTPHIRQPCPHLSTGAAKTPPPWTVSNGRRSTVAGLVSGRFQRRRRCSRGVAPVALRASWHAYSFWGRLIADFVGPRSISYTPYNQPSLTKPVNMDYSAPQGRGCFTCKFGAFGARFFDAHMFCAFGLLSRHSSDRQTL